MARHCGWALAALVMIGGATAGGKAHGQLEQQKQQPPPVAQPGEGHRDHDRGAWWKASKTVTELGLTASQSAAIDTIFHKELERMKPLREELAHLEKALDVTMKASTADVSVVAQQVERVENMRAELNKMRTVMLYRMRRVLNADQNAKFQVILDRREAERRKQDGDRRR